MPLLKLEQFGVAFGETIILRSVDLEVPEKGAFVLLANVGCTECQANACLDRREHCQ